MQKPSGCVQGRRSPRGKFSGGEMVVSASGGGAVKDRVAGERMEASPPDSSHGSEGTTQLLIHGAGAPTRSEHGKI
jgi:hypothetical protein